MPDQQSLLVTADYGFFITHTALVFFNIFGWIWPPARLWHLISVLATSFSWFVLAPLRGYELGYCICTDLHFQVRRELGYSDPESSYVQLLTNRLCGIDITLGTANWLAASIYVAVVFTTITIWVRWWLTPKKSEAA